MKRIITLLAITCLLTLTGCGNSDDHTNLKKAELESYFKEEGYTVVTDSFETTDRIHVFIYDAKEFGAANVIYQFQYHPDDKEKYSFSYTDTTIDRRILYFAESNKGKLKEYPTKYDTEENRKIVKKQKKAYKKWLKDLGIEEKQLIDFMIYQVKK